jgi:hypothetical protein
LAIGYPAPYKPLGSRPDFKYFVTKGPLQIEGNTRTGKYGIRP